VKPRAATLLVGSIRKKYPDLPIHVHTHDSAGTGVASMVACANAGADAVDTATDSMSGMTSQPSVGAVLASLEGTDLDPGLNVHHVRAIDTYWAQLRLLYSPFEAGLSKCFLPYYFRVSGGAESRNLSQELPKELAVMQASEMAPCSHSAPVIELFFFKKKKQN
jgi:pyruvate carboxylase